MVLGKEGVDRAVQADRHRLHVACAGFAQEAFEALAKKDVERMVEAAHRMELASLEVMQGLDRLVEGAEKNAELLACVKGGETARPERAPLSGAPKAAAAPTPPARSPARSR